MENKVDVLLEQLEKHIKASEDQSVGYMLDSAGFDYEVIEDNGWDDDGKYQNKWSIYKIGGRYFGFSESRSGSHFADWYNTIYEVNPVNKFEGITQITITLPLHSNQSKRITAQLNKMGVDFTQTSTEGWK